MKDAVGVLLEGTPSDVNIAELRQSLEKIEGVGEVHDLHVWSLTSGVNAMSAHVVVADRLPKSRNELLEELNRQVRSSFKISHTIIQIEDKGDREEETHL